MSIYATLWSLKFPRFGDSFHGCEWVTILAQGVPAHIGTPTPGYGYEGGDPYADFLPAAVDAQAQDDGNETLRAVIFVSEGTPKGTDRSGQEYVAPLLVVTGEEYSRIGFDQLYRRLCDALRGDRPRLIAEIRQSDGGVRIVFEEGSSR